MEDTKMDGENLTQEKETQPETKSVEEEFETYRRNSEKWVQKLIQEKKEREAEAKLFKDVITESKRVAQDENYLIDLYYEKPEIAKEILENYYYWQTIDEFKAERWIVDDSPKAIDMLANRKAKDIVNNEKISNSIELFIKEFWYDEEKKKIFMEEFNDITEWKKLTPENVKLYLEKSHIIINKDMFNELEQTKQKEKIAKQTSSWDWKSWWNEKETKLSKEQELAKDIVKFVNWYI